jgi:2'-5' RNA ligase
MQLYFIAIIPPAIISEEITSVKKSFSINHNSSRALKSPPHITLRPPFKMFSQKEDELRNSLTEFVGMQQIFPLELDGYGHFRKDVIYIKPVKSPELDNLFSSLQNHLARKNNFPALSPYPKFEPHITVAFRDLSSKAFDEAWRKFENQSFKALFKVESICLLKQVKQKWEIINEFPFFVG